MDGRHLDSQYASGDIRVDLDSSTPCWNDAIGILVELTETHPALVYFKEDPEGHEEVGKFLTLDFVLFMAFVLIFSLVVGSTRRPL